LTEVSLNFFNFRFLVVSVVLLSLLGLTSCDSTTNSSPKLPNDAAGSFNKVMQDIGDFKPSTAWHAIPKSYQQDIKRLIKSSSELIDSATYSRIIAMYANIGKTFKAKKSIFIGMVKKNMRGRFSDDVVDKVYDAALAVTIELVESDLAQHNKLKDFDVAKFLSVHGNKIVKIIITATPELEAEFLKVKLATAKQISVMGNEVKLMITEPNGRKKEQVFVKVENRWIPKKLQVAWKPLIAQAEAEIAKAKMKSAEMSMKIQAFLPMAEAMVSQLDAIKTEQDLGLLKGMFSGFGLGRR